MKKTRKHSLYLIRKVVLVATTRDIIKPFINQVFVKSTKKTWKL